MYVTKRNGNLEMVDLNKISIRIKILIDGYDTNLPTLSVEPISIAKDVCGKLVDGITTSDLDMYAAESCVYKVGEHIDYAKLASRILISNHHKNTKGFSNFSDTVVALYQNINSYGKCNPLISESFYILTMKHKDVLDEAVNRCHLNDYQLLDYFGMKTLQKSYLIKSDKTQERYQHMLMRQALAIYEDNIEEVLLCYDAMSKGLFTHATPTMFNAGTNIQQMSSCFLLGVGDSIESMYECVKRCAIISKWSGGIGIHVHDIRASGSEICGTNGTSKGILDYLRVLNMKVCHVDQGGGKRNGAIAIYLEPWHGDIECFLDAKMPNGIESERARELFYALWIPDLFMKRVKHALQLRSAGSSEIVLWSLMCPKKCPNLSNVYGAEFEQLYASYEERKKFNKQVNVLDLWDRILTSQKETGTPYMCYKDHVNNKSAQSNIGIIKSSNLCAEIVEYSDEHEYGTCNLASINLKKMTKTIGEVVMVDYDLLFEISKRLTRNLNRIIDINVYPVVQTSNSNFRHRPIGIGVQGLADLFILLGLPYESEGAQEVNKLVFETIYFGALTASNELAKERSLVFAKISDDMVTQLNILASRIEYYKEQVHSMSSLPLIPSDIKSDIHNQLDSNIMLINKIIDDNQLPKYTKEYKYMSSIVRGAYSTFNGSPAHKGILQYDMWNIKPSGRYNEEELKKSIQMYGLRNSLLVAIMPTATTAHILGNIECIEPLNSNMYTRQTIAGNFIIINQYLQTTLTDLGIWSQKIKDKILGSGGSIQSIMEIPDHIRKLYKTCWEMSKKTLITMASDRGAYVDQSQSFNQFISNPDTKILQTVHMTSWEKGLKTGMYYLRRKTPVNAQQFTVSADSKSCNKNDPACTSCSA